MKKLMVTLVAVFAMSGLTLIPVHAQDAGSADSTKSSTEKHHGEGKKAHHDGAHHSKKKSCRKEAKAKDLKGQERKDYIHQCMSS